MSFDRREFLKSAGKTAAAAGIVSVVANCGDSKADGDDSTATASSNCSEASTSPDLGAQLTDIAAYYGAGSIGNIADAQGNGTAYNKKVYANTGHVYAAEAATGGAIDIIQGMYLDPTDNHTPSDIAVTTSSDGGKTVTWNIKKHTMGPLDNTNHRVNSFDIWVAGAAAPVTLDVSEEAASDEAGVEYSQALTAAQVGEASFAYLISHCNKHGGRVAIFSLS